MRIFTFLYQGHYPKVHFTDIIIFCKTTCLAIIQLHNSGTEGKTETIFHILSDAELVALILK